MMLVAQAETDGDHDPIHKALFGGRPHPPPNKILFDLLVVHIFP